MTARYRPSTTTHDYTNYTYGCRCPICRQAKADYMRARRAEASATARRNSTPISRHIADTPTHGTRYAYEERGCRCQPCTAARTDSDRRYRQDRSAA